VVTTGHASFATQFPVASSKYGNSEGQAHPCTHMLRQSSGSASPHFKGQAVPQSWYTWLLVQTGGVTGDSVELPEPSVVGSVGDLVVGVDTEEEASDGVGSVGAVTETGFTEPGVGDAGVDDGDVAGDASSVEEFGTGPPRVVVVVVDCGAGVGGSVAGGIDPGVDAGVGAGVDAGVSAGVVGIASAQSAPWNPAGQAQVKSKVVPTLLHVPPFKQGPEVQGETGVSQLYPA